MNQSTRRWLIIVVVALTGILLVSGTLLIAAWFFPGSSMMNWGVGRNWRTPFQKYVSNGERIYFTGVSETGPRITSQTPGMHRMPAGRLACADCHGIDGRGGTVRMMMSSFEAPDIRYHKLTEDTHNGDHADHPPYTDEDIKRAITEGIDPSGEPLEWFMPRWEMTDEQLDDLIAYLMTLD
jgi:cytochrome c oxidase subunit II